MMTVKNSLTQRGSQRMGITAYLSADAVKNQINTVLGDPKRGSRFITAIVSAVNTNPALQECTNQSILSGALLGESLNLSPSPQLGQYYLVPFKDNRNHRTVAQFQLGYKGYIQLAVRSGQYRKLNVLAIKEGELISYDPLNEDIEVQLIEDEEVREQAPTIGYYAMFEYTNGFRKTLYWSRKKMQEHAKKYSQGYRRDLDKGTAFTFWSKDFDGMAYKTMLRQLISKWGVMSIDLTTAIDSDNAVIRQDMTPEYIQDEPEAADAVEAPAAEEVVEAPAETAPEPPARESTQDEGPDTEPPAEEDDIAAALFD